MRQITTHLALHPFYCSQWRDPGFRGGGGGGANSADWVKNLLLPPATRVFTPVCHSVPKGGVSVSACTTGHMTRGSLSRGGSVQRRVSVHRGSLSRGGSLSGGGSLSSEVSVQGCLC